ncbi:MAG: hypothetical protein Q8Q23_05870 [bacterium]|nr:hypothetical protein [bacterium]
MKKRIFLSLAAVAALAIGVVGMSAFEAHVINVTARIENALNVQTDPIEYGTAFPQESIDRFFDIALSSSFLDADRVDDVNYMIRQKPKCIRNNEEDTQLPPYGRVTENQAGEFVCVDEANYDLLPMLCPFLSKHEVTDEPVENDSVGIPAFHGPLTGWNLGDTVSTQVLGRLAKSESDTLDTWKIDFRAPCFEGECAQDWATFVHSNNESADPEAYKLDPSLKGTLLGCDLWVEVNGINETVEYTVALENKNPQTWEAIVDGTSGLLTYLPFGNSFTYDLNAQGLAVGTAYSLIYAPDPWPQGVGNAVGDGTGTLVTEIVSGTTNGSGALALNGSTDLGYDIPHPFDNNYPTGGKVWLVLSSDHDTTQMTAWDPASYLFEQNLISFNDLDN